MQLIVSLFLFWTVNANPLHLNLDLKKDKMILMNQHGGLSNQIKKSQWAVFEKYAKINISKYRFSKSNRDKHIINKWVSPDNDNIVIYEFDTTIPVDKLFTDSTYTTEGVTNRLTGNSDRRYHIKTNFFFHTYVIYQQAQLKLVYLSESKQGLCVYQVGEKPTSVYYEDIPVGFTYPNLKEIIKITTDSRL